MEKLFVALHIKRTTSNGDKSIFLQLLSLRLQRNSRSEQILRQCPATKIAHLTLCRITVVITVTSYLSTAIAHYIHSPRTISLPTSYEFLQSMTQAYVSWLPKESNHTHTRGIKRDKCVINGCNRNKNEKGRNQ